MPALTGGGMEEVVLGILEQLDYSNDSADILTFYERDISCAYKFEEYHCNIYRIPKMGNGIIKFIYNCWFIMKTQRYDVVNSLVDFGGVFVSLAGIFSKTKVVVCHSHSNKWVRVNEHFQFIFHFLFRALPCELVADTREAGYTLFGKGRKPITIIKNGIDTQRFRYNEEIRKQIRKELDIEDKIVVGNISRLAVQKNHIKQLEIFKEYHKKKPNSILLLIGDGELKETISNYISSMDLRASVMLLGHREDIDVLLQAMDIFLFPSLYEGLGIALINAQCTGLPCIASTGVPLEADLTGLVKYISLHAPITEWVDEMLATNLNSHTRRSWDKEIAACGYERSEAFKKYTDLFKRALLRKAKS